MHFSTSQLQNVVRTWCALCILTSKCASRHNSVRFFDISTFKSAPTLRCFVHFDLETCFAPQNGVHFFDISTSKSGPNLVCFVYFDFEMCFPPQRRPLFRYLNFRKRSDTEVFVHFDLETCFAPQNGVHFFDISTSKSVHFSSLLWPDCSAPAALASLLFDPPQPQIIGKHRESRLSYLFAHLHLLSSDSFSSLIFSLLLFSSLTLPTSAFPSVHIVGSLSSKLPSIIS